MLWIRRLAGFPVVLAALAAFAPAAAQDYPSRNVTIVTPTGPGSTVDAGLRFFAEKLKEKTGQTWLVENKVGAGGNIAAKAAAMARPDGYTLFLGDTSTMGANRVVFKELPYDPLRDFVPIQRLFRLVFVLAVNPEKTPVNSVAELTAFLKQKKEPLNYGYFTPTMRALSAQYTALAGLDAVAVGYRSSPHMRSELATGQVDYIFTDAVVATTPQANIKPLAVASDERSSVIPHLPTMNEAGQPGFRSLFAWFGVYGPAGTPEAIVRRAAILLAETARLPATRDFLATFAGEPFPADAPELIRFQEEFLERWKHLVAVAKIEPQ